MLKTAGDSAAKEGGRPTDGFLFFRISSGALLMIGWCWIATGTTAVNSTANDVGSVVVILR